MVNIPTFLKDTQVEKIINTELVFINKIIKEIKELIANFEDTHASEHLNSRFIAFWLSDILQIIYSTNQTLDTLAKNIDSVLFALRHIGTHESFIKLFKAFLNVDIVPTTLEPGVINIKLKSHIKTNVIVFIVGSTPKATPYKKIIFRTKENGQILKKAWTMTLLPKGYEHSIYAFIKKLIPIGRVLKIQNHEGKFVREFKG
ncbi:DUF735 family protein [Borrelia puertoricensis]|uniref:DUF735 family protein n=1 Tax=Borrelia puertoricensis TaxID=2756107 RepID=UPI001FF229BA|nr:DUF735 family protein [Borrelia puertoricensis]UPA18606.1 DUF735 family protein [Borrelia puertoricensis]